METKSPKRFTLLAFSLSLPWIALAGPDSAILFIGDGMGPAQVTAARIYQANARDGRLALDSIEQVALVRTYSNDQMVTDSAAAATALATGHKTNNGVISLDENGATLETVLELAKAAGKSVGLVTTTRITHATPACFFAHISERGEESEIARQLIDYGRVDVVMGGGRGFFLGSEQRDEESGRPGRRQDNRDLLAEAGRIGYRVIARRSEFDEIRAEVRSGSDPGKILALFSESHMAYEIEREKDRWGEPSIAEMTELAIAILSRNPRGYFLMVEGGRIDHAAHANRARRAVTDLLAFDDAVKAGLDSLRQFPNTLIVVTGDHETGGMAINGYPPIEVGGIELFQAPAGDDSPDIVTFATGPGGDRDSSRESVQSDPDFQPLQPALVNRSSASHTAVDVLLWAAGEGAEAFHGTMENSEAGQAIIDALGLAAGD